MKVRDDHIIYGFIFLIVLACLAILLTGGTVITGNPVVLWSVPQWSNLPCKDSDNGLSLYEKGKCTETLIEMKTKRTESKSFSDSCNSGYVLLEYYCSNDKCKSKEYTCSDACISGACMKPSTIKRTR